MKEERTEGRRKEDGRGKTEGKRAKEGRKDAEWMSARPPLSKDGPTVAVGRMGWIDRRRRRVVSTALEQQLEAKDPDVRLMLQVRDDVQGAFETLVGRYQHRLLGVMIHLVGRVEEAEDLTQEVFLRIYRARKGYKPRAKFSTWLFTIANNLAMNHLRGKGRNPTVAMGGVGHRLAADGARPTSGRSGARGDPFGPDAHGRAV